MPSIILFCYSTFLFSSISSFVVSHFSFKSFYLKVCKVVTTFSMNHNIQYKSNYINNFINLEHNLFAMSKHSYTDTFRRLIVQWIHQCHTGFLELIIDVKYI